MSILWKIFAALLAVTVLVWLSTMWRWESNQFDPGPSDLLLHLVVLPLVLTGVLVLTVWAVHRLRRYAVSPVASAAAATGGSAANASGDAALLAPKRLRARVLASAVQVRAGAGWRAAQKAIAKGDCASELDPEIKDEQGVCVFTAPMPDLDTEKVCAEVVDLLQELTVQEPDVWAGFEPATEMLRALTLMGDVLSELDETLNAQWHAWAPPQQTEPLKTSLPERTIADVSRSPELSVRVGIPEGWTALTQRLAMAWIGARLAPWLASAREAAEGVAPRRQMAHADSGRRVPVPTQVQAHVHPVAHAEALWQLGERQLQMWLQQEQAGLLVLVAADSAISESAVTEMARRHELFSGDNPRGRVPGEGAAALVCATPDWPTPADADPPLCWLQGARIFRRDKSADAQGRVSPAVMVDALTDAAAAGGWPLTAVTHLTSDADQRASRTGELFEAVRSTLPALDVNDDVLSLGVGCGDLGLVRLLACAGLAAREVKEAGTASLVVGALPAFERFAVLLTPTAEPMPAAASSVA